MNTLFQSCKIAWYNLAVAVGV